MEFALVHAVDALASVKGMIAKNLGRPTLHKIFQRFPLRRAGMPKNKMRLSCF